VKGLKKEESFKEFLTGLALKEGKFKVGGIILYEKPFIILHIPGGGGG